MPAAHDRLDERDAARQGSGKGVVIGEVIRLPVQPGIDPVGCELQ